MRVPTAPNIMIVMKLRKNCFFFTWNLMMVGKKGSNKLYCNIVTKSLKLTFSNLTAKLLEQRVTVKLT